MLNVGFLEELTTDKYKYTPFKKKKSVVHKSELEEAQHTEQQFFGAD